MADFPRKTFTVASTGHTYEYIRILPNPPSKSTVAFFHGFPAIAFGWRHQIKYFAERGHGIIAPDLLGYGGSSKPDSVSEYSMRGMVEDMKQLLDHEKIDKFHGVGHDAGTFFLSGLYNYHQTRLLSLSLIATPYNPPASHMDLEMVNKWTKELIGFEKFGYIRFLASDHSAGVIEKHLASFQSLAYHADVDIKTDNFYPPGKLEAWLEADRNDHNMLLDAEEGKVWLDAFAKGGLRGPTNWYRLIKSNPDEEAEKVDVAEGRLATKIDVPVLAIEPQPDRSSVPGFMQGAIKPHAKAQLTFKTVQSQGHYPHIVSRDEVNEALYELVSGVDS